MNAAMNAFSFAADNAQLALRLARVQAKFGARRARRQAQAHVEKKAAPYFAPGGWKKVCVRVGLWLAFTHLTMGLAGCADELAGPSVKERLGFFPSVAHAAATADSQAIAGSGQKMAWPASGF